MLVSLENVTFGYDGTHLAEGVSFAVHEKERVGFVGANGAGKTTLLRLLMGEFTPEQGAVVRKNGIRIGYLEQNGGFSSASTVYGAMEEVFREDRELIETLAKTQEQMAQADEAELRALSAKLEGLQKRIAARDSYHTDVRIKTVLGGMGFSRFYERAVATMSGGEKTRLKLCRLLLEEPDLLVLDEPTNHLDTETLFWLEDYLSSFKGALLIVSHDRYFLDRLTTRTIELENGNVYSYRGSYTAYKRLREERIERETRAYERQREEIEKLETYVERNAVRASTARSAQSRVNRLERMEVLSRPLPPSAPPRFRFVCDGFPSEHVLRAENAELSVGGKTLLKGFSFTLARGEKCAVVGENGAGKSTLLKYLLRESRCVIHGKNVKFACFDQENADLDPNARVLDAFWERDPALPQTEVRRLLAQAGLDGDDVFKQVGALSGGQRARLGLCVLQAQRGNVLFLDEPTNHLDLPARESLEEALKAFEGTVLFVSHDRRFIEAVATRVVAFENGALAVYGTGGDYLLARRKKTAPSAEKTEKRTDGYRSRQERAMQAQKKQRVREIETRLEELEALEAELNAQLAAQAADYKKVRKITQRLEELRAESEALYAEYAELI